jgi:hypothetical protein
LVKRPLILSGEFGKNRKRGFTRLGLLSLKDFAGTVAMNRFQTEVSHKPRCVMKARERRK